MTDEPIFPRPGGGYVSPPPEHDEPGPEPGQESAPVVGADAFALPLQMTINQDNSVAGVTPGPGPPPFNFTVFDPTAIALPSYGWGFADRNFTTDELDFLRFVMPTTKTVKKISIMMPQRPATGTFDFGLYDGPGATLLGHSGADASLPAATPAVLTRTLITPVTLIGQTLYTVALLGSAFTGAAPSYVVESYGSSSILKWTGDDVAHWISGAVTGVLGGVLPAAIPSAGAAANAGVGPFAVFT